MSRKCVCGADEPCTGFCAKHNRALHGWPCIECQREWAEANPEKVKKIERLVASIFRAGRKQP